MGSLSPVHWLIVIVVLVVLFGAKRLPDASRSLGRSLRIFKSEMKDMSADGAQTPTPQPPTPGEAPPQLPPATTPEAAPHNAPQHQAEAEEKAS